MDVKALLANKTALYVVLFASVASLLGYVVGGRTNAVLFFLLTGYVASHFTKNMIVILLAPSSADKLRVQRKPYARRS